MQLAPFALLPLALLIQGCGVSGTLPLKTSDMLETIPRVNNSPNSPCWQQRQIAAQNTAIDTALSKTTQVYKAPCDVDKPAKSSEKQTPVS